MILKSTRPKRRKDPKDLKTYMIIKTKRPMRPKEQKDINDLKSSMIVKTITPKRSERTK